MSHFPSFWKDYSIYLPKLNHKPKEKLNIFFEMLLEEAAPRGFIGKGEPEILWLRHILDSILVLKAFSCGAGHSMTFLDKPEIYLEPGREIVDLGTGAGLPGIPLAIVWEDRQFFLIDSSRKKVDFLLRVKKKLSLRNVTVLALNAEKDSPKKDAVIFRAFQKPLVSLELALNHLKLNGLIVYWRSRSFLNEENQEINQKIMHRLDELGIQILEHISLDSPEKLGGRGIYLMKRFREPSTGFPRKRLDIMADSSFL